ncbi:hypothetical protein PR048_017972 [Dryococelus australis]|uniref:Uncharacterized protein n=1 Tax=Dryococelus australis TaxID=614101 RepID=A0ABQ9HAZ4_9NEOP|nr:hypothetical protein PR048_017972 [Dryococelus australis]
MEWGKRRFVKSRSQHSTFLVQNRKAHRDETEWRRSGLVLFTIKGKVPTVSGHCNVLVHEEDDQHRSIKVRRFFLPETAACVGPAVGIWLATSRCVDEMSNQKSGSQTCPNMGSTCTSTRHATRAYVYQHFSNPQSRPSQVRGVSMLLNLCTMSVPRSVAWPVASGVECSCHQGYCLTRCQESAVFWHKQSAWTSNDVGSRRPRGDVVRPSAGVDPGRSAAANSTAWTQSLVSLVEEVVVVRGEGERCLRAPYISRGVPCPILRAALFTKHSRRQPRCTAAPGAGFGRCLPLLDSLTTWPPISTKRPSSFVGLSACAMPALATGRGGSSRQVGDSSSCLQRRNMCVTEGECRRENGLAKWATTSSANFNQLRSSVEVCYGAANLSTFSKIAGTELATFFAGPFGIEARYDSIGMTLMESNRLAISVWNSCSCLENKSQLFALWPFYNGHKASRVRMCGEPHYVVHVVAADVDILLHRTFLYNDHVVVVFSFQSPLRLFCLMLTTESFGADDLPGPRTIWALADLVATSCGPLLASTLDVVQQRTRRPGRSLWSVTGANCFSGRTPYAYKEGKSSKETRIAAERDWAAMTRNWAMTTSLSGERCVRAPYISLGVSYLVLRATLFTKHTRAFLDALLPPALGLADALASPRLAHNNTGGVMTDYSPTTSINRVRLPAVSFSDSRTWGSCRAMPLVGGFTRGYPVPPPLNSVAAPYSPRFTTVGTCP